MPEPVLNCCNAKTLQLTVNDARFIGLGAEENDPGAAVCSIYRSSLFEGDELRATGVEVPGLWLFVPDGTQPFRGVVLVIPGGGYEFISIENEGFRVARQLNALGYSAAVLLYRLPGEQPGNGPSAAIADVGVACDWLANSYDCWQPLGGICGLSLLGFSAGAHLALAAASAMTGEWPERINWLGLIYPVFKLTGPDAHAETAARWLSQTGGDEQADRWDGEKMLHVDLPDIFCRQLSDDPVVSANNARLLKAALEQLRGGDDVEVLDGFGHGMGLNPDIFAALRNFIGEGIEA